MAGTAISDQIAHLVVLMAPLSRRLERRVWEQQKMHQGAQENGAERMDEEDEEMRLID